MRIFSLDLQNFRQYKGDKKIEFSDSNGHNFTIIQGPNGSGKTNLLNAITWCLYGEEKHLSKLSSREKYRPVNNKAISEASPEQSIEMSVTIFLGNDSPEYRIKRSILGSKDSDGYISFDEKDDFSVLWRSGKDWKRVASNPNYFVNMLLPKGIHDFFFFDGERLDDFFKDDSKKRIREAIISVAQIDLLDSAVGHLDSMEREITRNTKDLNINVERIRNDIDRHEVLIQSAKNQLTDFQKDQKQLLSNIEEIDSKLRAYPVEVIQRLQAERKDLEARHSKLESELEQKKRNSINDLIENAPLVYCRDAILKTSDLINEKYQKGDLPSKVKEPFLRELLDSGKCICGTDISLPESNLRKNIENLKKTAKLSELEEYITDGKFTIQNMITKVNEFLSVRNNHGTKISECDDELTSIKKRIEDISQQIEKSTAEDIVIMEANRKSMKKDSLTLGEQIGRKKDQIETLEYRHDQLKENLTEELRKDEKFRLLRKQLELCENAEKVIKEIRSEVITEVKQKIQHNTREYFMSLIWKKETFSDIRIDDDYNISVIHKGGWDALEVLSAGERQILALSFMAALREAANVDAPVVIDTPLGRISGEPKENIAELLPIYLKNIQVILFVTDQEYSPAVRERLAKYVSAEYKLQYNEKTEDTSVVPYAS